MGALPNKFPGFQDVVTNTEARARFERAWGVPIPAKAGWHLSLMFEAMERGELTTAYILGENPIRSEADSQRARRLLGGLKHLVVQDIFLTDTAQLAEVVLPGTASWCEAEGTVTSSERRVQRVRKALEPPAGARDDIEIICELARRMGTDFGHPSARELWDELRTLSPMHSGMSYPRLEQLGGLQWPCRDEDDPGSPFLHGRLWEEDPELRGAPAPFTPVVAEGPLDALDEEYPIRLTTGRRLDSFNTGVQSGQYSTPIRRPEALDLSPEDMARLGLQDGEMVVVTSRRGSVEAPVQTDPGLRPGLAFLTLHFPEQVATNRLTLDAWDPLSGTAEFKATAIRVEKVAPARRQSELQAQAVP